MDSFDDNNRDDAVVDEQKPVEDISSDKEATIAALEELVSHMTEEEKDHLLNVIKNSSSAE